MALRVSQKTITINQLTERERERKENGGKDQRKRATIRRENKINISCKEGQ